MKIKELYEEITNQIIEELEQGTLPWHKPWASNGINTLPLRENGNPYRGINILILWARALAEGYESPYWMTYNQAKKLEAQVRKGEKGTHVTFSQRVERDEDEVDEDEDSSFWVHRVYTVFNTDQIDDLPEKYDIEQPEVNPGEMDEELEAWFDKLGFNVEHGGNRAFYNIEGDTIHLPEFERFKSSEAYYRTRGHESVHATGHKDRLDRTFGAMKSKEYAFEELIAELGSAFLCADLGIQSKARKDHASYIKSWLKLLNDSPKVIFDAASQSQKAVDFLHDLQKKNKKGKKSSKAKAEPKRTVKSKSTGSKARKVAKVA